MQCIYNRFWKGFQKLIVAISNNKIRHESSSVSRIQSHESELNTKQLHSGEVEVLYKRAKWNSFLVPEVFLGENSIKCWSKSTIGSFGFPNPSQNTKFLATSFSQDHFIMLWYIIFFLVSNKVIIEPLFMVMCRIMNNMTRPLLC